MCTNTMQWKKCLLNIFPYSLLCVCVCVYGFCHGLRALRSRVQAQLRQIFHLIFHLPPTSPTSPPSCDWVPGICWGANLRLFLMKQQWSRWDFVPTPLAVRKGLFSCEFLAWLQELCCTTHSACLVHRHPGSARCAWPTSGSKRICIFVCVCVLESNELGNWLIA